MLIQVVAMDKNRCIGKDGEVPFDLSDDRTHFRAVTKQSGTTCAGRKTEESIIKRLGRPLPNRQNLVLSRNPSLELDNCQIFSNHQQIVEMAREIDICIIGGGEIYELFMPHSHKLIVTHVDAEVSGDTFYPEIDPREWTRKDIQSFNRIPGRNEFAFTIAEYVRTPRG